MGTYLKVSKYYYSYIFENWPKDVVEEEIKKYISKIENFILYHYSNGSTYKNKFWRYGKKLWEKTDTNSLDIHLNELKKMNSIDVEKTHSSAYEYAQWPIWSIDLWRQNVIIK
jgi:hypothetical protein